jgi:O-antigen/teichoic acid export membrane protein
LITVAISTNFIWTGVAVQHQALLTRQMKLTQMAVVRLVSNALSIAIGVGLALGGYTYWALIWKEISRNLFIAIGSVMVCPWLPGWPRRNADMGDLLRFGRDVGLTSVLAAIVMNVDRLVVGKFFGAVSVGMYRQAQNLIMTPVAQLAQPISAVSQPGLCALQGERDRFRQFYQRIVLIVSVFTVPLGLFVAMYASDITLIVLGDQWVDAAPFVVVFGLAAAIRPAIGTSTIVVLSCGHAQRLLKLELLHSAALVVYMAVGVQFGATGVAVADLLRTVTLMVPTLYLSFRDTPVDMSTFFRPFSGPLLASGVMVTGLLLARASVPAGMLPLSSVALGGGVALVAYTGAWVLMGNARRELLSLVWQALDVFRGRSESRVQTVRAEL